MVGKNFTLFEFEFDVKSSKYTINNGWVEFNSQSINFDIKN